MTTKKLAATVSTIAIATALLMGGCDTIKAIPAEQLHAMIEEVNVPLAAPAAETEIVEIAAQPETEEPAAEQPVVEQPETEEPAEQPVSRPSRAQEAEEPAEEPATEEPAVEEPAVEEPAVEQPTEEPETEEPAVEEPVVEEPVVEEPETEEPETQEPAPEEPAVNKNHSRIDWLIEQYNTEGTTVHTYFSNRGAATSLDSNGFNWAPAVNEALVSENVIEENEAYTWRIYKNADKSCNVFWADQDAALMEAGDTLENVTRRNSAEDEYEDGTADVADKNVEGTTIQIIAGGTFEATDAE